MALRGGQFTGFQGRRLTGHATLSRAFVVGRATLPTLQMHLQMIEAAMK